MKEKKKKADCFLAEHRRRIAVFSIRATKTVRTGDSKFCSCCADILNQMTSPTAWILWKVRFQWLQNENEKVRLRDTKMKATWMSDKHKSINFIMPCFSCRVLGPGRQGAWQVYPKTSTNLLPSALLCVTTQCKYCQQRNGMSASVVAYSGKAKALPCVVV